MSKIVVVGGGVVGSSAAYHLARSRIDVTLVDRADEGHATAAGAGIISPGTGFSATPVLHELVARAVAYYPELLATLAHEGETRTGYEVVGALFVAKHPGEERGLYDLMRHAEGRRDAGVQGIGEVRLIDGAEARRLFPPLAEMTSALHIEGAARVDGRLLREALQRAIERRGGTVLRGRAVLVENGPRNSGVRVGDRTLPADAVVLAGGAWTSELLGRLGVRVPVYPQRGQIAHLELPESDTSRWPIVLGFHSHYLLTFGPNRVVAGATREDKAGHDPRVTAEGVVEVLGQALRVAPGLGSATLREMRVGLRPLSPDGLPLLGRLAPFENVYLATGHGPSGLQLGPYSGAAVAALAVGERVECDLGPFSPDRFGGR